MKRVSATLYLLLVLANTVFSQITPSFTIYNITNSGSITCSTPSIHLVALSGYTTGSITYSWVGPSASLSGSNISISTPGIYTVTALSGTLTNTQTTTIGINTTSPSAVLNPTSQNIGCTLTTVTDVTATATSPTLNITHQFASPFGGTLSVGSYSTLYTPGGPGTFTYILTDNLNGCSIYKTFTVNASPGFPMFKLVSATNFSLGCSTKSAVVISFSNAVNTITPGGPINFTLLSSPGNYSTSPQNSYTITNASNYTAVAKDLTSGCETKIPFSVIQNTLIPGVFAVVSSQSLSCGTPTILLEGFSSSSDVSIGWHFPGMLNFPDYTLTVFNNTFSPTSTLIANFTLTVTDNSSLCKSSSVVPIYQNVYTPTVSPSPPFDVRCPTPTVLIYPIIMGGVANCTFLWNVPAQANVSGIQTASLITDSPGIYTVVVTNTNNSCFSIANITVEVCVDINETYLKDSRFKVYPNPMKNNFFLEYEPGNITIENLNITNSLARIVFFCNDPKPQQEMDLSFLPCGIYVLKVQTPKGSKFFKVVKE